MARMPRIALVVFAASCAAARPPGPLDVPLGDEIVACGQRFHTGTRVVLWSDPGGYDAYLTRCFFEPGRALPRDSRDLQRYGERRGMPANASLAVLREQVWQCVLHYDAAGTSRRCFQILHDVRGLSCHFLVDLDGTIYQTLDLKERAWHAGPWNDHSIGVEIANLGATARPAAGATRSGKIHGETLFQQPFTDAQYEALGHLGAALSRIFPQIAVEAPRTPHGSIPFAALPEEESHAFHGFLGHFHLTRKKPDPGPAFDWERFLRGARER